MDFTDPIMSRLQNTQIGQPGYNAVNNFSSGKTPLPQEMMRNIANARARMTSQNEGPVQALTQMAPQFKGMTPEALTALQAILARNMGQSSYPGADTKLQHAVDIAYNPQ